MSSWDSAQSRAENHKGNSIFVRLADDGDKIVVIFMGEPFVRELLWNQKTNQYEDFTKEHEKAGAKSTPRYVLNVFVPSESAMKVMEFSNATFKDVLKVKEKYGLEKWAFEVERSGKKGDTKTAYSILPDKQISEFSTEIRKALTDAKLHDLAKVGEDKGDDSTDMSSHDKKSNGAATGSKKSDEAPALITAEQTAGLVSQLKTLEKKRVDEFLATFKVAKVKELKASDLAEATKLVASWVAPAETAEVDPFG